MFAHTPLFGVRKGPPHLPSATITHYGCSLGSPSTCLVEDEATCEQHPNVFTTPRCASEETYKPIHSVQGLSCHLNQKTNSTRWYTPAHARTAKALTVMGVPIRAYVCTKGDGQIRKDTPPFFLVFVFHCMYHC